MAKTVRLFVDEISNSSGQSFSIYGLYQQQMPGRCDGHSKSADTKMVLGGMSSYNSHQVSFASNSNGQYWGGMGIIGNGKDRSWAGASDGTKMLTYGGGWRNGEYRYRHKKLFNSSAEATLWGGTTNARNTALYPSGASDGSIMLIVGGYQGWSNGIARNIEKQSFTDESNSVEYGNMTQHRKGPGAPSDGSHVMSMNGLTGLYENQMLNDCDIKTFASNANAVSHGTMQAAEYLCAYASNGDIAMNAAGINILGHRNNLIEKKQFSSGSVNDPWGTIAISCSQIMGASDGDDALFSGGYDGSINDFINKKSFSSNASAVGHGSLYYPTYDGAAASGSSA